MRQLLSLRVGGSVLDLGAGSGRHAIFLAEHGFDVTAVDICPGQYPRLEHLEFIQADVRSFKPQKEYDIVLSTMLLHFLDGDELINILAMIHTATKIDGLNVISALTTENTDLVRPHLFKANELRSYYQIGWRLLSCEESLGEFFFSKRQQRVIRQHRAALIAERIS